MYGIEECDLFLVLIRVFCLCCWVFVLSCLFVSLFLLPLWPEQ